MLIEDTVTIPTVCECEDGRSVESGYGHETKGEAETETRLEPHPTQRKSQTTQTTKTTSTSSPGGATIYECVQYKQEG